MGSNLLAIGANVFWLYAGGANQFHSYMKRISILNSKYPSKRIIYTINPNDGKYMRDDDEILDSLGLYQGIFKYIPIFPLYTINCEMFDYLNPTPIVNFRTMLPIKRKNKEYLVEVRVKLAIDILEEDSYIILINKFKDKCEEFILTIDPTKLC